MMIQTKRLNLYPATNEQMERLIAEETIPDLKDTYQQMLDGCLLHPDQRVWYAVWNLERNDGSKTVVGNLSFRGLEADGILEIGYGIHAAHEGQGYMTEAVSAVVAWAATQNGVQRIEAETEADNAASQRVLQKSGFFPTGQMGAEGPRYVWKA